MTDLFSSPDFKNIEELLILKNNFSLKRQRDQNFQTYFNPLNSAWLFCSLYHISRRLKNVWFLGLITHEGAKVSKFTNSPHTIEFSMNNLFPISISIRLKNV